MTRIIGGVAGGRRLRTPPGERTRPTSDRVREALFSAVESWCGSWHDLRVLDLYAGSGAVGLEAWSRGAGAVTCVESDRRTAALIERNARDLGAASVAVRATAVATVLARPPTSPYDLVFLDPPYPLTDDAVSEVLELLVRHDWLAPPALVVLERSARSPEPRWPEGIEAGRRRDYGETTLWYGHAQSAEESADEPESAETPPPERQE